MITNEQLEAVFDALVKKGGTYYAYIYCSNCDRREFAIIPKGTTIEQFREASTCDNCGCKMFGGGE